MKKMTGLYITLLALLVISFTQFLETIQQSSQQKFIVYNVAGTSVYDVIKGRENSFYAPSVFIEDKDKMLFNIEHNWWKSGIEKQHFFPLDTLRTGSGILYFQVADKTVLAIDSSFNASVDYSKKLKTDFVILRENSQIEIAKVVEYFNPRLVIFDSSNSTRQCRKWQKTCKKLGLNSYDVAAQGAFVMEF